MIDLASHTRLLHQVAEVAPVLVQKKMTTSISFAHPHSAGISDPVRIPPPVLLSTSYQSCKSVRIQVYREGEGEKLCEEGSSEVSESP